MKIGKFFWHSLFLSLMYGCGAVTPPPFIPISDKGLQVVSVWPEEGTNGFDGNYVEVTLNRAINPKTLNLDSFFTSLLPSSFSISQVNLDEVLETLSAKEGSFEILDDGRKIRFFPTAPFLSNTPYAIVLTSKLLSLENIPLNQTPKEDPTPFFSTFETRISNDAPLPEEGEGEGETLGEGSISNRPSFLMLSEVFYDAVGSDTDGDLFIELYGEPEKDLSGYQILLINGEDGGIVDGLQIPEGLQTSSDGFFVIADAVTGSAGVTNVSEADWVANFDPQNGPDCVQLLDPEGNWVDALGYGSPLVLRAENNELCYEGEPALDAPGGSSLERNSFEEDQNNNLLDWQVSETPTPGN